jgi:prepilin-type N-terminal cleavage/methylation domain-containing protein/prepilin-type processing-associated H-X9-DG protein
MAAEGNSQSRRGAAGVRRGAFTLIELLVVIAIIALLVSILLPSLKRAKDAARRVVCGSNLRGIHLAMSLYLDDSGETYPCAQDPVSTSPFYWLWMGRGWRTVITPYLGSKADERNPSVLFCGGDAARDKYEATSYAYSMCFYHSPEQIDAAASKADTYSNPRPFVPQKSHDVLLPFAKVLIGEWTSNHPRVADDAGWWCWHGRRNYLFADGSILFLDAREIRPARDGLPDPNLTIGGIRGEDLAR